MRRRLALTLSFIVMESLGIFLLAAVLAGPADQSAAAFPAFFFAEAGGFYLVRALFKFEFSARVLIPIGAVISLVCLITIAGLAIAPSPFPPGWDGVLRFFQDPGRTLSAMKAAWVYDVALLVAAWVRGVMISQDELQRDRALRSFSVGLGVLVIGLLFGQEAASSGAVNGASLPLVGFGLLTLTLIHLRDARPGQGDVLQSGWLFIAAGTIAALLLVGLVIGVLPLGPAGFVYDRAIGPALTLLVDALAVVIVAIAFPFTWLISSLLKLFNFGAMPLQQADNSNAPPVTQTNTHGHHTAPVAIFLAKGLVALLVIAVIAYLSYRLFRRLHRPLEEGEDRESLSSEGSLAGDLAALWRHLRPRPRQAAGETVPRLPAAILEVRRLYLRSLSLAERRGVSRPASSTPDEFEPELVGAVGEVPAQSLTEAFVEARYGGTEPTEQELRRLRELSQNTT